MTPRGADLNRPPPVCSLQSRVHLDPAFLPPQFLSGEEEPRLETTLAPHLEVQGLQLGSIDQLTDVLVGLVEGQRLVSKQAVG